MFLFFYFYSQNGYTGLGNSRKDTSGLCWTIHTWSCRFEPKCWTKNIFSKGEVTSSCRIKRMLSIKDKELWFFDTTTIWTSYVWYTKETSSENHLEPNVCGSTLVQPMDFFSFRCLFILQKYEDVECQGGKLWVFNTTTTLWTSYYNYSKFIFSVYPCFGTISNVFVEHWNFFIKILID